MQKYLIFLLIFTLMLLFTGCGDNSTDADDEAPEAVITNPVTGAEIAAGEIVTILVEASDNKGIEKVEFTINGVLEYEDNAEPYQHEWNTTGLNGDCSLLATAWDNSGNTGLSDVINVNIYTANENNPPDIPGNTNPFDGAENVSIYTNLIWSCSDPDGDALTYDVYFGTDPIPDSGELVSEDQSNIFYDPGTMNYETTYYWKIIASDGEFETSGQVWHFNTGEEGNHGDMIYVEGGSFEMGDHYNEGISSELPVHTVSLNSFFIGQYEVTYTEYIVFLNSDAVLPDGSYNGTELINMDDTYCAVAHNGIFYFSGSSYASEPECPVIEVTWYGAAVYCNWLSEQEGISPCYDTFDWSCDFGANGYRLPTEAEWEYAARGGIHWEDNYRYSGTTENLGDYAWYGSNSGSQSHRVGTKLANQLGIYDMSGNVYEWCNDWYDCDYYGSSPEYNPTGLESGDSKVFRGGSWVCLDHFCRVANRFNFYPDSSGYGIGFRLLRSAEGE